MAETIRCPSCGGLNPASAQWCGQCLQPLEAKSVATATLPTPPPDPAPNQVREAPPSSSHDGDRQRAFAVSAEGITWTCPTCETRNPIDALVCSVCGTTFSEMVHPPRALPERDPNTVALVSLFFPGAGHAYLGLWAEAVARAVVTTWALAVALIAAFASDEGGARLVVISFGMVSFVLWAVTAHDAYRVARKESDRVLLRGRGFLFLVLGLLGLLMLVLVASVLSAR